MGIDSSLLFVLLILQVTLFYRYMRVSMLSPLFWFLFFGITLPFIISPFVLLLLESPGITEYHEYLSEAYFIINIIFFSWSIGYYVIAGKRKFNWQKSDSVRPFMFKYGLFLIFIGIGIYVFFWYYVGISFFSAFAEPLATRFKIINTTGAYHIRNIGIWCMLSGYFIMYFSGDDIFKKKKIAFFSMILFFIIVIFTPLGERSKMIFPILMLTLALFYDGLISKKILLIPVIVVFFAIPFLGLYRSMGESGQDFSAYELFSIFGQNSLLGILLQFFMRSNAFEYFLLFLANKDDLYMSFNSSIISLITRFMPVSMIGGHKPLDLDGYLTSELIMDPAYGQFHFTVFPEWYLNFNVLGYVIMAFLSGMFYAKLISYFDNTPNNIFLIVLFSNLFIFNWSFIRINNALTVEHIYFLIFALFISMSYKILLRLGKKS